LARFGPLACLSARPFVCPALLVPARLVSHATAARAVYFGLQLAACRLCLPCACRNDRPSIQAMPVVTLHDNPILIYRSFGLFMGNTVGSADAIRNDISAEITTVFLHAVGTWTSKDVFWTRFRCFYLRDIVFLHLCRSWEWQRSVITDDYCLF